MAVITRRLWVYLTWRITDRSGGSLRRNTNPLWSKVAHRARSFPPFRPPSLPSSVHQCNPSRPINFNFGDGNTTGEGATRCEAKPTSRKYYKRESIFFARLADANIICKSYLLATYTRVAGLPRRQRDLGFMPSSSSALANYKWALSCARWRDNL